MDHRPRRWRLGAALVAALLAAVAVGWQATAVQALDNGVARTPPMGWNSWNTFGCSINETLISRLGDAGQRRPTPDRNGGPGILP
ncbi:hypothetical protein [Catellatospora tritici]|uniref:hypothetical protein n=1 Tax=Catellatospora tritici TaxID=2851566 RepID=UPI0020C24599|nr:hypothetical protein [Catellatospora tritici]